MKIMEDTQFIDVIQAREVIENRHTIPEIDVVKTIYATQFTELITFIKTIQFQEVTRVIGAIETKEVIKATQVIQST